MEYAVRQQLARLEELFEVPVSVERDKDGYPYRLRVLREGDPELVWLNGQPEETKRGKRYCLRCTFQKDGMVWDAGRWHDAPLCLAHPRPKGFASCGDQNPDNTCEDYEPKKIGPLKGRP